MWLHVIEHFAGFQRNFSLSDEQHEDVRTKATNIAKALWTRYYTGLFDPAQMLIVGSYGKKTAINPTSDVDMMFALPMSEKVRFDGYNGNRQSALLAEVRGVLLARYPRTTIRSDGQVVIVDYDSFKFEVLPVFAEAGEVTMPDTNDGGNWKRTYPVEELSNMNSVDLRVCGHARALTKYLKVWKRIKYVPLSSITLEIAALHFTQRWMFLNDSLTIGIPIWWHDWLVRDFFEWFLQLRQVTLMDGTVIPMPAEGWKNKAEDAHRQAALACHYEHADSPMMACFHWNNIFGTQFPNHIPSITRASSSLVGV